MKVGKMLIMAALAMVYGNRTYTQVDSLTLVKTYKELGIEVKSFNQISQFARNQPGNFMVVFMAWWFPQAAEEAEKLHKSGRAKVHYVISLAGKDMWDKNMQKAKACYSRLGIDYSRYVTSNDALFGVSNTTYEGVEVNRVVPYTFVYKNGKLAGFYKGFNSPEEYLSNINKYL